MWTQDQPARKLASIGVAVKKWVTLHGFALNVATDLSRFAAINPCGLEATVMSSVSVCLDRPVPLDEMKGPRGAAAGPGHGAPVRLSAGHGLAATDAS